MKCELNKVDPEVFIPRKDDAVKVSNDDRIFRVVDSDEGRIRLQTSATGPVVDFWIPKESAQVVGVFWDGD